MRPVDSGRYKKRSASFYAPDSPNNPVPGVYYLRHVGWLGALPPGVKGLDEVSLTEAETGVVYFSESVEEKTMADTKVVLARLRDWLVENLGQKDADKLLSEEQAEAVEAAVEEADPKAVEVEVPESADAETLLPEVTGQLVALSEENQQLKEEMTELQEQFEQQGDDEELTEFGEVLRRKVSPRHRSMIRALLMAVSTGRGHSRKRLEFGEGSQRKPIGPALRNFIRSLPDVVEFGESATRQRATPKGAHNPLVADAENRAKRRK